VDELSFRCGQMSVRREAALGWFGFIVESKVFECKMQREGAVTGFIKSQKVAFWGIKVGEHRPRIKNLTAFLRFL
jgi:hypothetical protein